MRTWDARTPIYRQLAAVLGAWLLDGRTLEGEAMPSVRMLAGQYLLNPLTVARALQLLTDDGVLEHRRGLGLYVRPGARERLRLLERDRFLRDEWPELRSRLQRLGLGPDQLSWKSDA